MSEREKPRFEDSLERLDEIVHDLESGDVPLDDAIHLFEEGLALSKKCAKLLDSAEARIEKLLENASEEAPEFLSTETEEAEE